MLYNNNNNNEASLHGQQVKAMKWATHNIIRRCISQSTCIFQLLLAH